MRDLTTDPRAIETLIYSRKRPIELWEALREEPRAKAFAPSPTATVAGTATTTVAPAPATPVASATSGPTAVAHTVRADPMRLPAATAPGTTAESKPTDSKPAALADGLESNLARESVAI